MSTCRILAQDNIGYLQQGVALLGRLSDETFARSDPESFGSSVCGHLRHCIDHYDSFIAGLAGGRIDYDDRKRDVQLEKERKAALARLGRIIQSLSELSEHGGDIGLLVKMDSGNDMEESEWWSRSSVRRELQFLISHTVHHYALIALALKLQKVETGPEFGVAPSTLRYNQARVSCAR